MARGRRTGAVRPYAPVAMSDQHEQYEQLAVGHVLGGLSAADAANFRSHLLGCRNCRSKVAELRGIEAELADAEREERSRERVRTELPRRAEDQPTHEPPRSRVTVRHVTLAAVLVIALAGAMAFWNFHLRTVAASYLAVAESQADTLEGLATGVALELELADDVAAAATTDGERVYLALEGVADLADGEYLVAWLVELPEEDGAQARPLAGPGQPDGDVIATSLETDGARRLVVTRESDTSVERPTGTPVLETQLSSGP